MSIASLGALVLPVLLALPGDVELGARRTEATLLHRSIDLRGTRVWQARSRRWDERTPGAARLLVVHLWAVDCPPCVAEFPILRDITRAFQRTEPDVHFAYLSETLEEDRLLDFFKRHKAALPVAESEMYQLTDTRLRQALGTTQQPVTLLVDRNLVVRQAFVGSIAERRSELVEAIERLLAILR